MYTIQKPTDILYFLTQDLNSCVSKAIFDFVLEHSVSSDFADLNHLNCFF